MGKKFTATFLLALLLAAPLGLLGQGTALADDVVPTQSPPVLTVHSTGGTITLIGSDEPGVRVISNPNMRPRVNRFDPSQMGDTRIMLPEQFVRRPYGHGYRVYRLPARQFTVPMARFGSEGVNVENPGGDLSIAVPRHAGAVFINAEAGNVEIQKMHAPFIISATTGDVHMVNVGGRGLIRTTTGAVTLGGVSGDLHVQTASGAVTVYGSTANSVDVQSDNGPIYFRFARCGNGVYRFRSKEGTIRLGFRAGASAQVDAQSDTGNVQNLFPGTPGASSAVVSQTSAHAVSMAVNGGGPEITVTTTSGDITLEPVAEPPPLKSQ
ncbi:MAG: DUF4097 family beta strand repeat protein [Candidatus Eremiobacteraeota bacterium]|nr:DUF4097 family beta strand repeat protein [Candidatus Eremiobacteraeota bacterium]